MTGATGLHHVTLITRHVQANVDFYVGFLGLRLVKRTGGYEDATQLHLFYGDRAGSPGSLITFLVWEDGSNGRVGNGQVSEVAFAVPPDSMGEWLTRALLHQVRAEGPVREFGEPVLRLKDPDGIIVKLVGVDMPASDPWGDERFAIRRLRSVTILTEQPEATTAFLKRFGYARERQDGSITRVFSQTDAVDVRDASGYVPGVPGTGTADHVAFRAADVAEVKRVESDLSKLNSSPTTVHDRKYFTSLYVREPGGTLLELATDGPGFALDEPVERLGERLFVPPSDADREDDIRILLPQFSLPGEPRMPARDLPFIHRFHQPDEPDGSTLVLLHGAGSDEAELMPLAHRIAPRATLLGVRGRSLEQGSIRWFRATGPLSFDQADIRSESDAFAAFLEGAATGYGLDRGRMTFLGHSNGANFLAAFMGRHPAAVRRAILLRAVPVLDEPPSVDLSGTSVLLVRGSFDLLTPNAALLADWFTACGASVDVQVLDAGHELTPRDAEVARDWLERLTEG